MPEPPCDCESTVPADFLSLAHQLADGHLPCCPHRTPRLTPSDLVGRLVGLLTRLQTKHERLRDACARESHEIEQTLGLALRYPRYCDDQKNFPDATPDDGVCVAPEVAATLAMEAADRIRTLESAPERKGTGPC